MTDSTMSPTSAEAPLDTRRDVLNALSETVFDICVIGGGITGAGVAREAALAGYKTALLERDDFASGTSSRSSRLVHGGVRYLEHGHLALVFESSRERRILLNIAPHLVRPLAFTWPVWRGARVPLWKVRAGLTLYDALSLFRNVHPHDALSANEVLAREPALNASELLGGARYWDAATDDTRLTLASVLSAREAGAVALNHARVTSGVRSGASGTDTRSRLEGVHVVDTLTNEALTVRARVVVNATGPWSDATVALTASVGNAGERSQLMGSAGSHIAVPRHRLGNNDAVTLVSPLDGRVMFALPAGAHAIIGTTEVPATRGPDEIRATEPEVQYLLTTANRCFPNAALTMDDVISAWSGIRPLAAVRAGHGGANAASREHSVAQRDDGLVSVTGGKLTTYRAMAVEVLQHATRGISFAPRTRALSMRASAGARLPGGDIRSRESLLHDVRLTVDDHAVAERLAVAFGSRWRAVWSYAQRQPALLQRLVPDLPYIGAEVIHAVDREMACTLSDVLIRRMHLAFETRDHGRATARRIAPLLAARLGWSAQERDIQLAAYDADVTRLFSIEMV